MMERRGTPRQSRKDTLSQRPRADTSQKGPVTVESEGAALQMIR